MPDPHVAKIKELIADYEAADKDMTEANVEAAFVARLFAALGWAADDPTVWNRQVFVRGGGFADVGLQIQNKPVLLLEAKRFGKLKGPARAVQAALFGEDVVLSQADRQRAGIDRTPEEKQAMRYARAQGVSWAVLTNFERLVLFDANEERIVLAFDAPEEYVSRFDDLKVLAPQPTPQQFHSHLNWYKGLQKKADVDADFFEFLSRWRVRLAQDIFDRDAEREEPLFHPPTSERLERLMEAVQRVLDRLIILRYADDVGVLLQHDLLENLLTYHHGRLAYVQEYDFQREVNRLFQDFYRAHNTTIFAPGHVCERVLIGNECLVDLTREISSISFRKFSSDILGNTYESYLGQKLQLVDGQLLPEVRKDVRKGEGIYYTPGYIVRYIVDHTLGRWLYGTSPPPPGLTATPLPLSHSNGRGGGGQGGEGEVKTLADRSAEPSSRAFGVSCTLSVTEGAQANAQAEGRSRRSLANLRVLDPAMGSGSFLIYAFDVLADFYERENARIEAENNAAMQAWSERAMKEGMFGKEGELPPPRLQPTVPNYIEKILQEHLYGVDLDPEAVEIAGVNLIMAAFRRLTRNRQPHRKLPLILRQNLKCGNSLISGDRREGLSEEEYNEALVRLIQLRGELQELHDDTARAEKLAEIEAAAAPLNAALNESLRPYFGNEVAAKRPFNWAVEFPEAFDPRRPEEQRGFTVVVGNPPYIRIQARQWDEGEKRYLHEQYESSDRNYDAYVLFVERGSDLLAQGGHFGYIVPNKFFQLAYGENLRGLLIRQRLLSSIVSFGDNQVFPAQTTYTCLLLLRQDGQDEFHYYQVGPLSNVTAELPAILDQLETVPAVQRQRFPIDDFGAAPWVFAFGVEKELLQKINQRGRPLRDLATNIMQGLITSADDVYILEKVGPAAGGLMRVRSRATRQEHELEPDLLKPLISGEDVDRYGFALTDKLLLFPYRVSAGQAALIPADELRQLPRTWAYLKEHEKQLRRRERSKFDHDQWYMFGRHQNLEKQDSPKICVAQTVKRLEMTLDAEGEFYLHNVRVNGIILADSGEKNYYYVLALLNSALLDFIFKSGSVRHRGGHYAANRQFIENLPIRTLDLSDPAEKAQHDALAELARRMLDLNRAKQEAERAFTQTLRGYERETESLWRAYWDHAEYRPHLQRQPLLDANATGQVSAIAVDEVEAQGLAPLLIIRAEVDGTWQDVAHLTIPDEDFRLFLFFALRQFLHENRRKKVWVRGRVLRGVLEALCVPVLVPASAAANLVRIARLVADFRAQCPPVGAQSLAPLHLSELERTLRETDAEIDRRVYDLYGLTEEERRVVEESVG